MLFREYASVSFGKNRTKIVHRGQSIVTRCTFYVRLKLSSWQQLEVDPGIVGPRS